MEGRKEKEGKEREMKGEAVDGGEIHGKKGKKERKEGKRFGAIGKKRKGREGQGKEIRKYVDERKGGYK